MELCCSLGPIAGKDPETICVATCVPLRHDVRMQVPPALHDVRLLAPQLEGLARVDPACGDQVASVQSLDTKTHRVADLFVDIPTCHFGLVRERSRMSDVRAGPKSGRAGSRTWALLAHY